MVASCPKLQWVNVAVRPDVSRNASFVDRLGPELAGVDRARIDAVASGASRVIERVNAGEPFIGWAWPIPDARYAP